MIRTAPAGIAHSCPGIRVISVDMLELNLVGQQRRLSEIKDIIQRLRYAMIDIGKARRMIYQRDCA